MVSMSVWSFSSASICVILITYLLPIFVSKWRGSSISRHTHTHTHTHTHRHQHTHTNTYKEQRGRMLVHRPRGPSNKTLWPLTFGSLWLAHRKSQSDYPWSKSKHLYIITFILPGVHLTSRLIGSSDPMRRHRSYLPDGSSRSGSWSMPTTTMPWPCWDSAHSSSLPPSAWWIVEVSIVEDADYQLFIHSVRFIECILTLNLSFCTYYIYYTCPSWRGILLCCSSQGFFPFSPLKGYLGVFPSDVRFWVLCVQIVKHSETNF